MLPERVHDSLEHHTEPSRPTPPESPSVVILVPVYENASTLEAVVTGCAASGLSVVIVDDGGRDGSAELALALVERGVARDVVHCPRNLGKAGALRLAFAKMREAGFQVAVTVDADGQHDPTLIRPLLEIVRRRPTDLVVGCRWPLHPDQPRRNLLGRTFSNVAIRAHAGVSVGDAPCGFRAWPLDASLAIRGRSGRYAWEQEMISRLAWKGVGIASIDVPAIYHPRETRVSHYRFGRDWPEGIAIYLHLLLVALIPRGLPASRPTIRRVSRFLSPGPLRGRRPEIATNRWFTIVALAGAFLAGGLLPISLWTIAAALWVGWRWHLGAGPILLASLPSALALPVFDGAASWLVTAVVGWTLGGLLRRPVAVVDPAARGS